MKKPNWFTRSSPFIMCCIASLGVVGTAITAVRATPKAFKKLENAKKKNEELSKIEAIKTVALSYIPSAAIGLGTIFCIFGASALSGRSRAAYMSAYILAERSFKEYKDKLKELYGEEVHNAVEDAIVKEKCKDTDVVACGLADFSSLTPHSDTPETVRTFYDSYSERYFESTFSKVISAEYHLNRNFMLGWHSTLNEFYEFLGLENIEGGDSIGWNRCDGIDWIDFDHRMTVLDDGMEIVLLDMVFTPTPISDD